MIHRLLTALIVCLAVGSAAAQHAAACVAAANDHDRWAIKNQPAPATLNAADEQKIDVNEMLTWRVPINIPDAMRMSNGPITRRERDRKLYALTGFVRVVKLQADCDFHVQVAQSRAANAPQVIVEVPHGFCSVQRELMALVGMGDGQKAKLWKEPSSAPHLRFI